jgi:uncharacterized protein
MQQNQWNAQTQWGGVARTGTISQAQVDAGLRAHMLHVYNYVASGLALSGLVATWFQISGWNLALAQSPILALVAMFAPLVLMVGYMFMANRISVFGTQAFYWVFTALFGISLSYIFLRYTGTSIARAFFITAATFGAISLYGYTTKTDLSRFSSFLIMGLFGLVIASVVNVFLQSDAMQFVLSIVGLIVFIGLTAWNTQEIKEQYLAGFDQETTAKLGVQGALSLYLNFVNLFQIILSLTGVRNND